MSKQIKIVRSRGRMFAAAALGTEPKFRHDCDGPCCAFHGRFWPDQKIKDLSYDVWISSPISNDGIQESVMVLRKGDGGPEYRSFPLLLSEFFPTFGDALDIMRLTDDLIADGRI